MANAQIARDARDGSKKVKEVCIDFRTREDEALAQKLQDEEFETHYIRNRQERGTARVDVKTAKETYLEEVKKAGLLKDVEYQRLAEDDAWLAVELQQRLDEEEKFESQQRAAGEMQDEEYAQFLEQREKQRLEKARHRRLQNRIERERREFEKIERDSLAGSAAAEERRPITELDEPHAGPREEKRGRDVSHDISALRVSVPNSDVNNWNDRRSYEADQSENLSRQQELKDEEYARELQRKEQDKLQRVMEERDRRLAMKIQRKEADEYRRERAERQMRRAASMPAHHEKVDLSGDASSSGEEGVRNLHSQEHETEQIRQNSSQERQSTEQNGKYSHRKAEQRSLSIDHTPSLKQTEDISQRPRSSSLSKGGKNDQRRSEAINEESDPTKRQSYSSQQIDEISQSEGQGGRDKPYVNVAASIDPTYKGEADEVPHWTERRWGLDDGEFADPSKPAPVIQNTKRKKSSDKKAKDKNEKCKQQ